MGDILLSEEARLRGYFGWVLSLSIYISFIFPALKNLYAHPTYLRFGLFCKFLGDFWRYLGINGLSQRISIDYGTVGNFEGCMLS